MSDARFELPPDPYQRPDRDCDRVVREMPGLRPLRQVRILSWRRRRKMVVLAVIGLTIATLLAATHSSNRAVFLSPGALTNHHAQILAGQGGEQCAACHGAGSSQFWTWTADMFSGGQVCPTSQSELCLKCHQKSMDIASAPWAHTISSQRLAAITEKQINRFQLAGFQVDSKDNRKLACAACHVEHQGANFNLAQIADAQCQTCHLRQFDKFETNHPDFAIQPGRRPRAIQFDHATHLQKYFPERKKEVQCSACHIGDPSQNVMRLASFDQICSECHGATPGSLADPPIVLLELPILDLKILKEHGIEVGDWPQAAQGDFDGQIHAWAWKFLEHEPEVAEILDRRGFDFQFGDVDPADLRSLQDAGALARGLKQVLGKLAQGNFEDKGTKPVFESTQGSVQNYLPPPQFFQDALSRWFAQENRSPAELSYSWSPPSPFLSWQEQSELLAKNPLAGLNGTNATDSHPVTTIPEQYSPSENKVSREGSSWDEIKPLPYDRIHKPADDNTAGENHKPGANPVPLRVATPNRPSPSTGGQEAFGEWLAQNPLSKLNENKTDSIENLELQRNYNAPPNAPIVNQSTEAPAIEPDFSSARTTDKIFAGWYRDDRACRIEYRPIGHADSVIVQMSCAIDREDLTGNQALSGRLRLSLTNAQGTGRCAQCHTNLAAQDRRSPGWKSELRVGQSRGFTRFNHSPHLLQLDCLACHRWSEPKAQSSSRLASWSHSQESRPEFSVPSNFSPLTRSDCSNCHRKNQAPNSCTTCHRYHVD